MKLEMLKKAMKPLEDFGKDEIEIDINGTVIVLKTLLPIEEVACQRYASGVLEKLKEELDLEDAHMSRHGALDYFDKFRTEVISYALVQVGDLDFREVEYLETGEHLGNGVAKKIKRQVALRDLIQSSWSRAMLTICFSKYGDLIVKLSEKAEKIAETSFSDLVVEIERLEVKLEKLKQEKDKRAYGDPSVTAQQIQNLVEIGKVMEQEIDQARVKAENLKTKREKENEARKDSGAQAKKPERRPVIPEEVPPPTPGPSQEELIQKARKQAEAQSLKNSEDPLSSATPVGRVQGVEAYRLPSQTISERGQNKQRRKAEIDPDPKKSSMNPNFKPRR